MKCVEFTQSSSSIAIVGSSVLVGTGTLTLPARYAPHVQIMVPHDLRTLERTLRPSASFDAPQGWAPLTPQSAKWLDEHIFCSVVCCLSSSIYSLLLITVYFRTLYFRTIELMPSHMHLWTALFQIDFGPWPIIACNSWQGSATHAPSVLFMIPSMRARRCTCHPSTFSCV